MARGGLVHDRDPRRARHGARCRGDRSASARALVGLVVGAAVAVALGFAFGAVGRGGRRRSSARSAARSARRRSSPARCAAAARAAARAILLGLAALVGAALAFVPVARLPRGARRAAARRCGCAGARPTRTRACAPSRATECRHEARRPGRDRRPDAVDVRERRRAGAALSRRARRVPPRRVDVPVAHAGLPLVDRDRRASATCTTSRISSGGTARSSGIVEYGSSFGAVRAAGLAAVAARHDHRPERAASQSQDAETVYEALEDDRPDDGGDQHHVLPRHAPPPADDPRRAGGVRAEALLLLLALRERPTGAPIAVRNRALGSIDAYAASVGRWLVTRDGFDFLVYYLPDYDFASHAAGPDTAHEALARSDAAVAALMDAAGGPDAFLERYAVVVCSDHGQSQGRADARASTRATTSSPRRTARRWSTPTTRARVAERLDAQPAAGIVLFREDGRVSCAATATRTPRCSTTCPTAARAPTAALAQPERRRGARLGRAGLGVRRPRGPPPSAAAATARSRPRTPRCRC